MIRTGRKIRFLDLPYTSVYICAMHVGICKIRLRMPENGSLKDKRHVVKSIIGRVKNRFDVAVAEVEDNDDRRFAAIGVSCISNDRRHANEILSKVAGFVAGAGFEAEVLGYSTEIIPVFEMDEDIPFPADYP